MRLLMVDSQSEQNNYSVCMNVLINVRLEREPEPQQARWVNKEDCEWGKYVVMVKVMNGCCSEWRRMHESGCALVGSPPRISGYSRVCLVADIFCGQSRYYRSVYTYYCQDTKSNCLSLVRLLINIYCFGS